MKRSKINSEIRHMEELIQEHGFEIPPFASGLQKNGIIKALNMMKSVIIC